MPEIFERLCMKCTLAPERIKIQMFPVSVGSISVHTVAYACTSISHAYICMECAIGGVLLGEMTRLGCFFNLTSSKPKTLRHSLIFPGKSMCRHV